MVTSPLEQGGRALMVLRHELVIRGTLLGAPVDNRLQFTYHIDPATGAFIYHDSAIEQGRTRLTSAIRVEGRTARVADSRGGAETVVELPADVVLANTLLYPHLQADFVGRGLASQTYQIFDGRDGAVREVVYTRTGAETLRLAGKSFDTVVLDSSDRRTGVVLTEWLDTRTGMVVQTRQPGGFRKYLTDASIVDAVTNAGTRANLTPTVLTKTNLLIRNVRGISYMKVRAVARPSGLRLTAEALSVPGQRFSGTVQDNLVEGVFEIAHPRYDGAQAAPFPPPDYARDPSLRPYLEANEMIQADDAVLRDKAREITAGSRDSWEATRRLSEWVAKEIKGAIPGGITARGTFDQRAGECGGHSFLMAALSRSVGIPARVVWGVLYVPDGGGAFGRHGWNEIYMGAAGWIPLDTTIRETDYVDSGHIRIGVFTASVATNVDMREVEILEHRVTPAAGGQAGSGQGPARFDAYVGEYKNTGRGVVVKVSERDGALVADIPGQIALTLKEPDADGVWRRRYR